MNKSHIEWCDYTINPVKGLCPMECSYCYARRMYKRFKWNPEIRFEAEVIENLCCGLPASKIFVGSTIELFGDWIKPEWMESIFDYVRFFDRHTFIFLTKQPQNLIKWNPFPENCWVGVTITDGNDDNTPLAYFKKIEAEVKFISFEPLLRWYDTPILDRLAQSFKIAGITWVIIGQQTPVKKSTMPKLGWVEDIVRTADKVGIPVFLKENLRDLFEELSPVRPPLPEWAYSKGKYRQEFPND